MRIQANSQPPRTARYGLSMEPARQRLVMPDGDALAFPMDGSSFYLGSDEKCLVQWEGAQPKQTEVRWNEGTLWARGQDTLVNGPLARTGRLWGMAARFNWAARISPLCVWPCSASRIRPFPNSLWP